ncbi:serine peptidase [Chromatiales bacterium (ex Bugula neritina AB1)]|nr:serine peptidase [Chromatiales bacterium (ex Bugula neritina AB1)]
MFTAVKWFKNVSTVFVALALVSLAGAVHADLPDFTELVEQNHKSVVNISTTAKSEAMSRRQQQGMPDLENSPFGEFFKKFLEQQEPLQEQQFDSDSLGSGFIVSSDGFVLTNNHVIDGAEEIIVRLHDRRQYVAKLIGKDARSDVAVLKIDAEGLPAARIGRSSELKVGEWVLAIGSPFGFDFSVTAGIVSATGRSLPRENYVPFIQTDVAINPGNSGGPLFNLEGEVVGINSQIYSRTGGFMGLSFSIPIEMAIDIADQLKENGKVSRGWLGVIIQEVTRELAESFSMATAHGALISRILPDSPAAASDLQVGDIIVRFNQGYVDKSSSLPPLVGQVRAGRSATVDVIRNGKEVTLEVTIGELPGADELASAGRAPVAKVKNKLGIEVDPLDDEVRQSLSLDSGGVVVTAVNDGPAKRAGVQEGDVLTMIDNALIKSMEDFEKAMDDLEDNSSIAVLVQRPQGPIFLALTVK